MENRLSIDINGKILNLPSDFSIEMVDVNPYFNDNESFSYEVPVSVEENREVFKDVDNIQSDKRLVEMENASMRLRVNGMPFRSGRLQTSEDAEVSGNINISMISAIKTLNDLIADKNCQDIPVKNKIQIGEMVGNVLVECQFKFRMEMKSKGKGFLSWSSTKISQEGEPEIVTSRLELQALGYSFPGICSVDPENHEPAVRVDGQPLVKTSFINVSDEYPAAKYCNARVCYKHYKKEMDGTSGKTISTSEDFDPYYVLDADRPQSGVCFYVLYFLDCLFSALNMRYDNTNLLKIGDMRRLCFFTTHCKYDLERKYPQREEYDFQNIDQINEWLTTRNTQAILQMDYEQTKEIESVFINGKYYKVGDTIPGGETLKSANFIVEDPSFSVKGNIMNMYANSRNFPDASVSSVLDSLWGSFGVRFLVDYDKQSVKAVFIRDLFRNTQEPLILKCDVLSEPVKINEKITGVRMRYSAESDNDKKKYNITSESTNYDTNYDYIDYSNINTTLDYLEIIKKQSSSDKTCYIDLNTGNRYRLKVNSDAEKVNELKPSILEVGAFTGIELGDCSKENEDFIEELISDFEPIIPNDVNIKRERLIGSESKSTMYASSDNVPEEYQQIEVSNVNTSDRKQILAMYVDKDMWHENVTMTIQNAIGSDHADFYLKEVLNTNEAYDVESSEDGNSPLQTYDWGMAVGIMRGGGADATVQLYDWNYDGHGNSKWRTVAGEYAMSSDSLDNWASQYDYNGVQPGIGDDERFSMKIRAYIEKNGKILCNDDLRDEDGKIETKIRSRGLFDTFMSEYAHFLLNRKKISIKFRCEVAEIANIQWDRRYNIGGYIGWINKLSYTISAQDGLGIVTAELYQL